MKNFPSSFKRAPLGVVLVFFAQTQLFALGPPSIFSPEAQSDFGEKASGDTVTHTFTLRNTGGGLLKIRNVRVSCGCTASHLSKRELAPGDVGTLTVTLDLTGRSGPQNHYITVHSNDPRQPQYSLNLRGTAVPKFKVTPRTLNFQRIDPASPPNGVIRVEATGGHTLGVNGVSTTQDRLNFRVETVEENKIYDVHVSPKDPAGQGHFSDVVQIETTDKEDNMVRAIVMWQIQPPVSIAPGQLSLVIPRNPQPVNRFIMVRANEDTDPPLELLGVKWPGREVDVNITSAGNRQWRVELRDFTPDMDMNREEILIETNLPGYETLKVPVRTVRQ